MLRATAALGFAGRGEAGGHKAAAAQRSRARTGAKTFDLRRRLFMKVPCDDPASQRNASPVSLN